MPVMARRAAMHGQVPSSGIVSHAKLTSTAPDEMITERLDENEETQIIQKTAPHQLSKIRQVMIGNKSTSNLTKDLSKTN